jgi:predicted O-methyltransferase YrrM
MTLNAPIKFSDAARGVDITLHGAPEPSIRIQYHAAEQGIELVLTAALTDTHGPFSKPLAELASVIAEPGASQHDEARLRFANLARRAGLALPFAARTLRSGVNWLFTSREDTNYSYDLTPRNQMHLAHTLAAVTGRPAVEMAAYLAEPAANEALTQHIMTQIDNLPTALRAVADCKPRYARRLGWYALARALKPTLVVETGVDKGLGGVLMCAALLRNADEGRPGRYLGTDIRPSAGYLVSGAYAAVGSVAYGDSLASLAKIDEPIGIFINDSDHSLDYETREYQLIAKHLRDTSIIISDNAYVTDALANFAAQTDRRFLFFREDTADHFYPGAGIGLAYK